MIATFARKPIFGYEAIAFSSLGATGGQAGPAELSDGIAKALFHTLLGLCLAIPFAVFTASPAFGRWAERVGLCAIPDEIDKPETLRRISEPTSALPAAA